MGDGVGGTVGGLLGTLIVLGAADLVIRKTADLLEPLSPGTSEGLLNNDIP